MGADDGGLSPKALTPIDTKSSVEWEKPQGTPDSRGSIADVGDSPGPSSDEDIKLFSPPGQKLTIASLDKEDLEIAAQYNPRDIQIGRFVQWQMQLNPELDKLALEFSGEDGRTFQLELLFDGYEEGKSVQPLLDKLTEMASASVPIEANDITKLDPKPDSGRPKVRTEKRPPTPKATNSSQESSSEEHVKRPHWCFVTWGKWLPKPLTCVIETIITKYQMFSEEGEPLRVTTTLSLREATSVAMASLADRRRAGQAIQERQQLGLPTEGGLPVGVTNIPGKTSPGIMPRLPTGATPSQPAFKNP